MGLAHLFCGRRRQPERIAQDVGPFVALPPIHHDIERRLARLRRRQVVDTRDHAGGVLVHLEPPRCERRFEVGGNARAAYDPPCGHTPPTHARQRRVDVIANAGDAVVADERHAGSEPRGAVLFSDAPPGRRE